MKPEESSLSETKSSGAPFPALSALLPHGPPMMLLDELVDAGKDFAVARVHVSKSSLFYQSHRGVPAWIGLEYMAQTVGVIAGMQAHLGDWELTEGFLLGSRRLRTNIAWFTEGMVLTSRATEELMTDDGIGAFRCTISLNEQKKSDTATGKATGTAPVAECRITIYRNPPGLKINKKDSTVADTTSQNP